MVRAMIVLLSLGFHFAASAELTPGARYFSGTNNCSVELLFSADQMQATVRVMSPSPHFVPSSQTEWISAGPHTARYIASRSLYRFQDSAPGAPVKDLIVYASGPGNPTRLSFLYWHAGHHDPVHCQNLTEATTAEQLQEMEERFAEFGHSH